MGEQSKSLLNGHNVQFFENILSNAIRNTMNFRVYHPPKVYAHTYQEPFSIFFSSSSPVLYKSFVNFFL